MGRVGGGGDAVVDTPAKPTGKLNGNAELTRRLGTSGGPAIVAWSADGPPPAKAAIRGKSARSASWPWLGERRGGRDRPWAREPVARAWQDADIATVNMAAERGAPHSSQRTDPTN